VKNSDPDSSLLANRRERWTVDVQWIHGLVTWQQVGLVIN
jgi:hypothetical protein